MISKRAIMIGLVVSAFGSQWAYSNVTADAITTLETHLNTLTLTIGISPAATNYGLRSITLFVNDRTLIEPHAQRPDGTAVTAHALITEKDALGAIHVISEAGLFNSAVKLYSTRTPVTPTTPPPPENAADKRVHGGLIHPSSAGSISLICTVFDDHWYTYYEMSSEWNSTSHALMNRLSEILSGEAKSLVESLFRQMKSVQRWIH